MSPWETLGLDTDASRTEVKRAYSKLIRQFRPDDNPTEFQRIREAYEQALQHLHYAGESTELETPLQTSTDGSLQEAVDFSAEASDRQSTFQTAPDPSDDAENHAEIAADRENQQSYEVFKTDLTALLDHFSRKTRFDKAELIECRSRTLELLHRDIAHHWDYRDNLYFEVFDLVLNRICIRDGFLSTQTNLPDQMLLCFDEHFLWTLDEAQLYRYYGEDRSSLAFYSIHQAKNKNGASWNSVDFDANQIDTEKPDVFAIVKRLSQTLLKSLFLGSLFSIPITTIALVYSALYYDTRFSGAMFFLCVMTIKFGASFLQQYGTERFFKESLTHIVFGTIFCLSGVAALIFIQSWDVTSASALLAVPLLGYLALRWKQGTL